MGSFARCSMYILLLCFLTSIFTRVRLAECCLLRTATDGPVIIHKTIQIQKFIIDVDVSYTAAEMFVLDLEIGGQGGHATDL